MAEDLAQNLHIRVHALDNTTFTPVYVSVDCAHVDVENAGEDEIYIRTDSGEANTQKTLAAGAEFDIGSNGSRENFIRARAPLFYAKTAGSTGPLILRERIV